MKIRMILFVGILLLLFACASLIETGPISPVEPKPVSEVQKAGWEVEWNKTVDEAKKEGILVLVGNVKPPFRDAFTKAFKEKFGIDVEVIAGSGTATTVKIDAERKAGIYSADIYIGGTSEPILFMKPKGMLDYLEPHLILPEVLEPSAWYGGELRWIDKERTMLSFVAFPAMFVGLNTTFVKKGEIEYFRDLLNPRWKGKMGMFDPTTSGPGLRVFHAALVQEITTLDYWRELVRQEPRISRDHRLLTDWLAGGKTYVQLGIDYQILDQFIRAGATIDRIALKEGNRLSSSSVSMLKNPAHPKAAKVFINWFFTGEGQTLASKVMLQQSVRIDAPTDHLLPIDLRQPGVNYFISDSEEFLLKESQSMKLATEIFAPLIK